ncbi:hypothetical protein B0J17DRAFT_768524 [Rhizoctonia solani]|nr:hypothetical protein B0J17DRAFT_768524 [Rhizoctonia solani]
MSCYWIKGFSLYLLLCLLCTCRHLVSATIITDHGLGTPVFNCLQYRSHASVNCEPSGGHFATDQTIPRFKALSPRAEDATNTSNSTNSTSGSSTANNSSAETLTIVIATVGLVFVGFLLYFAWQCLGCIRGPRSGKPVFGYVGV